MALVSKILEATLTAGSTTVTFTDSDIPNSLIRVFSSNSDIIPESRILSGNTLTVVYASQSSNIDVAVEIVKQGLDIVDDVISTDTDKALSAKQGYLLNTAIGNVNDSLLALTDTVNELDITDLDDVTVTDIQSGQVLAWDDTAQKFVNVNQSGGSLITLTTKAWTATSSSAPSTVLTESATLTPGLYLVNVHTPYSSNLNLNPFGLYINDALDVNTNAYVSVSYGNFTHIIKIESTSTIAVCSVSSNPMSWDSTYLSRGGLNIIKLS